MSQRHEPGGRLLLAAVAACVILALLPARWTQWAGWLAEPMAFVVQPVAHPVTRVTRWLLPDPTESDIDDPERRAIVERFDEQTLALRQAELRIEQLERQVRDLQSGVPVAPGARVRQVWAPVTARSSNLSDGTIRIGAGRAQDVEEKVSVATARGVHLIGRVIEVEPRTSWVLPFNHVKSGHIQALVLTGETLSGSFACQLHGVGDGRLEGDMIADAVGIEPGQLVRLKDESWPAAAQMLILGRVVAVDRKENQRLMIVVEPEVSPERVSEVVLRISESTVAEGAQ